ncbi:hypothetical protein DEDE109153_08125 [Deinococcus deserti]|uniref:Uncharacterized protein n=1 Tax=Deinococcus deserti (strain DSM 17065 / CIP 109153 / LMG 22923 / VCD115) TaxID=546414 RepID=X5H5S2_DEIDV|nr:hypothetical protein Deide_3p01705 [Deinococcus deserti VCD115]
MQTFLEVEVEEVFTPFDMGEAVFAHVNHEALFHGRAMLLP